MPRTVAFALCRYSLTKNDQPLSSLEQIALLRFMKAKVIAYRKREPTNDDKTTFLLRPRIQRHEKLNVLTWIVADRLTSRFRTKYKPDIDDIEEELDGTDELRSTRFIAIPRIGALAIDDRSGERYLGAKSASSRFAALCKELGDAEASISFAGTPQDVEKAFSTWSLDRFDFTVRPSNPHPPKLGEKLEALFKADGVGRLHGVATATAGTKMKDSKSGLIAEARGLSDAGYGQYGAKGTTPNGLEASISSPKFDMSKENNLRRQAETRTLKIHIDQQDSLDEEDKQVIQALMELYGKVT